MQRARATSDDEKFIKINKNTILNKACRSPFIVPLCVGVNLLSVQFFFCPFTKNDARVLFGAFCSTLKKLEATEEGNEGHKKHRVTVAVAGCRSLKTYNSVPFRFLSFFVFIRFEVLTMRFVFGRRLR